MKNLFIGVDFSKEKVDVAIIFADGLTETAARVFNEFKTTVSGYKQLVKWVEQNSYGIDSSLWLFCGENTGDYSELNESWCLRNIILARIKRIFMNGTGTRNYSRGSHTDLTDFTDLTLTDFLM